MLLLLVVHPLPPTCLESRWVWLNGASIRNSRPSDFILGWNRAETLDTVVFTVLPLTLTAGLLTRASKRMLIDHVIDGDIKLTTVLSLTSPE